MRAPTLPLPMRLLNAIGRVTPAATNERFRLDKSTVLNEAVRRTGLSDFGNPFFETGLDVLLGSIERDTELHLLGQIAMRETIIDHLVNRLRLAEARQRTPQLFETTLVPPLVVTGLHRSGTTHLHRLLAQDPDAHAPPYWQLVAPLVHPGQRDTRREQAKKSLARRTLVMPDLSRLHSITADAPEECFYLTASSFESVFFWSMAPVTGYLDWYVEQDRVQKYQEYRAWLHVLQAHEPTKRLVLKAPEHLGALDALLEAVPEAQVVQIHRDPVTAYASFTSMTRTTQALTSPMEDTHAVAETNLEFFATEISRNRAAREHHPGAVYDVSYDDLLADPMATVAGVYADQGRPVSPEFADRLAAHVATHPQNQHGTHHYDLEDFGVTEARARHHLGH